MLEVVVWLGKGFDIPALGEEDDKKDDVIDYHCAEGDFGDELVLLLDEDAKVKDEDGDFGEGGGGEVEEHACPADL